MLEFGHVKELAVRHQVQPESLEKVLRLQEFLERVNKHPFLSARLALKGGTALNLFFGPPKRLSVDLDFNYVGGVERELMQQERPDIERAIESVGTGLRYAVQTSAEAHAGRTWHLGYVNHAGGRDRMEVDVSYINRVPLLGLQTLEPWSLDDRKRQPILLCSPEELVAGKLRALLDRVAARDFFDAGWVMPLIPADRAGLFRRLFVLFAGGLAHPLPSYSVTRLESLTARDVEQKLVPMLLGEHSANRDSLVSAARIAVAPFLQLDEAEREFSQLLNAGEYRPDLILSGWPEVCERLARHPALLWKAQNALKKRK